MNKKVKTERFEMRVSPAFKSILKKLSEKKEMKAPHLIEFLVRIEAEKEKIKT